MPITIRTHPIQGEAWRKETINNATATLQSVASTEARNMQRLMQSSFSKSTSNITPSTNGLVDTAIAAWNNHHHLVLRPDDVWVAIISQLGFFIDAHAEELRAFFVAHEGKRKLTVTQFTDPDNADYGEFAMQMADQLSTNVNDLELVPWVIPSFSTTTDTDRVAASVLLMGAMKQFFDYDFCCSTCGIPSVTLLGTRDDWADLQARIDKIPNLGGEAVDFHRQLKPIARHMVLSFDEPESPDVLEFWRAIASWEPPRYMGSGPDIPAQMSGWITTFCFWTCKGEGNAFASSGRNAHYLDGVQYRALSEDQKVYGWAAVPVNVISKIDGVVVEERKCRMVAGSVGMRPGRHAEMGVLLNGPEPAPAERTMSPAVRGRAMTPPQDVYPDASTANAGLDAVQPHIGWWVFEEKERKESEGLRGYDSENGSLDAYVTHWVQASLAESFTGAV